MRQRERRVLMLNDYFTWNGKKSSDFGIIIKHKEIYKAPVRDVDFVEVPGRDGEVILDNGRYRNVDVTYQVRVKNVKSKLLAIANWLSAVGYQKLIDSDDSTHYRMAARTGSVDWDYLGKGEWADLEIAFNCKPFRSLATGDTKTTLTAEGSITNPTQYTALPYFKIYGSGNFTLKVNNKSFAFTSISSYIECDSSLQAVFTGTSSKADRANFDDFPTLKPGANSISWTGTVTKVEIVPHWHEL